MGRILVTGGNGYVGHHVVKHLLKLGHDVVTVVRKDAGTLGEATVIESDLFSNPEMLFDQAGRPDTCIHLAWQGGFNHQAYAHLDQVADHIQLVKWLLKSGLGHMVTIGTVHEIGYHVGKVTDLTAGRPQHPYGIAKNFLQQTQAFLCAESGAVNQWLRCFYITGDDWRSQSIFRKILEIERNGGGDIPMNSGELLRDFVDVETLSAQIALVSSQRAVDRIINCGSGVPISLKSGVNSFVQRHAPHVRPIWGALPVREYDSPAIWGDVDRLNRALDAALGQGYDTTKALPKSAFDNAPGTADG